MSDLFDLNVEVRTDTGKGASRRLRREQNRVPGILYGAGHEPVMLTLAANEVKKALENEAFYSHILTLKLDGKAQQAVLKDIQRHPARSDVIHMDFLRVTGKEAITMHVPLHFINEDKAPGVKAGGIVSHTVMDVEIKCLPKDLPEFIEVDLSKLELDHAFHMSELVLPNGVTLTTEIDANHDLPVASIHVPKAAQVEEAATEEVEAKSEEKPEGDEA